MLTSMLLNELQKRTAENRRQAAQLTTQAHRLAALEKRLVAVEHTMAGNRAAKLASAFDR